MSRIASYPIQSIIIGADKVIGTDALNNSATKNFTFDDVAVFLNTSNKIEVNALRYSYQNHVAGTERKKGTISFSQSAIGTPAFSSINSFMLSKTQVNSKINVSSYYSVPLITSTVLISQVDNPAIFGIYKWNSAAPNAFEPEFFDIGLTFQAGTGNLAENKDYFISLLTYGVIAGDKTYVFSQPTNATPWVVFHGLNKFPSVSVVNTANITVYGEVEYDSLNQVTISFNDATNGKAYFN